MLAGLVLVATMAIVPVAAQDQDTAPRLSITPVGVDGSYFAFELSPGEQRELAVELGNFGSEMVEVRTYAADVLTQTNGGFGAKLAGEPVSGTTTWVDYPDDTFEMKAGEKRVQGFKVTVPDGAHPGEYITSLVIQNAEPVGIGDATPGAGFSVNQVLRQVIAVAITIPGLREPGLEIGEVSYQATAAATGLYVAVTNSGNVHLSPDAEIVLRDANGSEVTRASMTMGSFYSETSTSIVVGLLQPLDPGEYRVSVTLSEDGIPNTDPIKVTRDDLLLTVAAPEVSGTPAPETIGIESVAVNELRDAGDSLQAVEVLATIDNPGAPVSGAQLTLTVERDGALVEEYVLGSSLSFPTGSAEFRQRYVPIEGWTPGTYSFSVTLAATDPNTGELVELTTVEAATTVTVS
jgi:hypothetical protein